MTPALPIDADPRQPVPGGTSRYQPPDPLWSRNLVVTVSLSSFSGVERQAAREAGYSVLAVLLDNDPLARANGLELINIRNRLRVDGWKIVGWAPTYLATDADQADLLVSGHHLDGWIPNLEAWAEGEHADLTPNWLARFRSKQALLPLLVSCLSSDTDQYARDFAYKECLEAGATIAPQVYAAESPGLTVQAMQGSLALAGVPLSHVAPWFGADKPLTPEIIRDYQSWPGAHGLWTGDSLKRGRWPL
jgi:hypothetical protein